MRKIFSAIVCSTLCFSSIAGPGRAATVGREIVEQNTQARATRSGMVRFGLSKKFSSFFRPRTNDRRI